MIKQKNYSDIYIDNTKKDTVIIRDEFDDMYIERENLQQLIDALTEIQNQTLNKILDK